MSVGGMNGSVKKRTVPYGSQTASEQSHKDESAKNTPSLRSHEQSSTSRPPQAKPATIATTILAPTIVISLVLIFGGCCSNVYALESIVKLSPASGTLFTFFQFICTAVYTLPTQLRFKSAGKDSTTNIFPHLRQRIIPIHKWLIYTVFFLAINILNNAVFGYKISIPLHIIIRSASPVTSMIVGYIIAGRRYSARQVFAVLLLFAGVVLAALSDAQTKSHPPEDGAPPKLAGDEPSQSVLQSIQSALTDSGIANQLPGFMFLVSALILSAVMGVYTDKIYDQHGRSPEVSNENLFYSHILSMPWFFLQRAKLNAEWASLMENAATINPTSLTSTLVHSTLTRIPKVYALIPSAVRYLLEPTNLAVVSLLVTNGLTQIICITGVNRLSTETTSLTVTIVLNIRKLVSLLLSIWLFGNELSIGVAVGAGMVFLGGGIYGLSGTKRTLPRPLLAPRDMKKIK